MMSNEPFAQSPVPFSPRSYQLTAIRFLLEHANAGLFLKPGLGKTSTTLAAITFLKKRKMIRGKILIIAPVRVCYSVWPREIHKWADFGHLTYEILHGPDKGQALKRKADIYLINPEGIDWLLGTVYDRSFGAKKPKVSVDVERFEKLGFSTLVVDELAKYKAHDTNRFKAMRPILHTFDQRWGLTGSPAANGLLGLWGQCFVLDMGGALGPYVTHYRNQYFIPDVYGHSWKLQHDGAERIYERLAPLVLQMDDDLLDMPALSLNDIRVQLPADAMRVYRALEKDMITAIQDNLVTAATAAAASMKLRQIASGGIYLDAEILASGLRLPKSERKWANLHTAKVEALQDLVEELQGQPLLVAYDFEHDVDRLRAAFPKAIFACDFSAKQFDKVERDWNAGKIEVLFGHPQSIGHGLNLQEEGRDVCFHSQIWDFDLYDQFIRRVYRQGNKHRKVTVHRIIAEDTVDELICGALAFKDRTQQAVFDGLKKLASERGR